MKTLLYLFPVLIILFAGKCDSVTDCSKCESELALAKSQNLSYQKNIKALNTTLQSLSSIKDSLQSVVNILEYCPDELAAAMVLLESIEDSLNKCQLTLNDIDTIFCDTLIHYIDTVPFILKQNCMFYVLDTFRVGDEHWFVIDRGKLTPDTIKIFYDESTFWFVHYHFKDTIINRTNTVYAHNTTNSTPVITGLIIKAVGSVCENDYPVLNLFVNNEFVSDIIVNSSDSVYISIIDKPFAEITSIKLVFDNDCYLPEIGEDRNVEILSIVVNNAEVMNRAYVTLEGNISWDGDNILMPSNGAATIKLK